MALIDEITLQASAGKGGDGVVRWLHVKGIEFAGPSGGNGGDGGDVYIRGVRDLNLLSRYRSEKKFAAGNGNPGEGLRKTGAGGDDFTIDLPVGSVVRNKSTGEVFELTENGQTFLLLKGGRGGAGNAVFKSSTNRSPEQFTPGARGEEAELFVELRLIANAGLIGLPNAGKTSLLNALTRAEGKVASYAFTTLDPNLGALYEFVLADIPGLIEGAGEGKGLGFKFLRHIARTNLLVHCVSLESEVPLQDYQTVRNELQQFEDGSLLKKQEMLVLTKSDSRDSEYIKQISSLFAEAFKKEGKKNQEILVVSILDEPSLKKLSDAISKALR
ncbi:MAG: GTPase ObgE [bacterium]